MLAVTDIMFLQTQKRPQLDVKSKYGIIAPHVFIMLLFSYNDYFLQRSWVLHKIVKLKYSHWCQCQHCQKFTFDK